MSSTATLALRLKQLHLPTMFAEWKSVGTQAETGNWSYGEYLLTLAEKELISRREKRIQRYTKAAKLPPGKTLDRFDFRSTPSVNAAQITALAENTSWVESAHNLIIFGPSGVGKTHLAAAITYRLIEEGTRALFMRTTELVQKLQQAKAAYKLPEALTKLARYPLLVLDDIGYVKKDDKETSVLFELIADRYECQSLIITANQPFSEWDNIFPDNVMAVAAVDRLIHHASILNITDESYRKKHSKTKQ